MGRSVHQQPVIQPEVTVTPQDATSHSMSFSAQTPSDSPNTALNRSNTVGGYLDDQMQQLQDQALSIINAMQGDDLSQFPQLNGQDSVRMSDLEHGVPSSEQPFGGEQLDLTGTVPVQDNSGGFASQLSDEFNHIASPFKHFYNDVTDTLSDTASSAEAQLNHAIDQLTDIPDKVVDAFSGAAENVGDSFSHFGDRIETEWDTVKEKGQNVFGDITSPFSGWKEDIKEFAIIGAVLFGIVWCSTSKQRGQVMEYGKQLGKRTIDEFMDVAPKVAPLLLI